MGFLKEFKTFIMRGNIIDLAVAVVIGSAFGSIVSSLVDDIITPLLLTPALHTAGVDEIAKLHWDAVKYGSFLAAVIKFFTISLVLFAVIKGMNAVIKKEKEEPAKPSNTDVLLSEIRDLLKK